MRYTIVIYLKLWNLLYVTFITTSVHTAPKHDIWTDEHQFPYAVLLQFPKDVKDFVSCTGTIISKKWILTAAHCYNGNLPFVQYPFVRVCLRYIQHKNYKFNYISDQVSYNKFDIALLETDQELPIKGPTGKIPLSKGFDFWFWHMDDCTGIGYEVKENGTIAELHYSSIPSPEICDPPKVQKISICLDGHKDVIPYLGDTGGPLVCSGLQVGLVSITRTGRDGYAYQFVYSSVAVVKDWVMEYVKDAVFK